VPETNDFSVISKNLLEVANSPSKKTPAKNGLSNCSVSFVPNFARRKASVR
jgi:hypothetical protein